MLSITNTSIEIKPTAGQANLSSLFLPLHNFIQHHTPLHRRNQHIKIDFETILNFIRWAKDRQIPGIITGIMQLIN